MKKIKKVLFVSHGFPSFMSDILFHGLKTSGYEVTEYPEGNHYYGGGSDFNIGRNDFLSFCYFRFPRSGFTFDPTDLALEEDYDAVILTSWRPEIPNILKKIYKKFQGKIPIAFVDGEDDTVIRKQQFYNDIYFKREFYGGDKDILPITFGIIDKGNNDLCLQKKYLLSFIASGHNKEGLRCQMFRNLKRWEDNFPIYSLDVERSTDGMIPYVKYKDILKSSEIGISIAGVGQDTYRYWEVPYYGALLMSQRLDIKIQNGFTDMENVVFFDDINDFNSKLEFLMNNPKIMKDIAQKGHEHLMKYHTSKNRASYVISELEKIK